MRHAFLRSLLASFLLISLSLGAPIFACYFCKPSPDGKFHFCNPGANRGYNDCTESISDSFNGNTTCVLTNDSCPYGVADGGGGPIDRGGDTDCYWMIDGECQLYY